MSDKATGRSSRSMEKRLRAQGAPMSEPDKNAPERADDDANAGIPFDAPGSWAAVEPLNPDAIYQIHDGLFTIADPATIGGCSCGYHTQHINPAECLTPEHIQMVQFFKSLLVRIKSAYARFSAHLPWNEISRLKSEVFIEQELIRKLMQAVLRTGDQALFLLRQAPLMNLQYVFGKPLLGGETPYGYISQEDLDLALGYPTQGQPVRKAPSRTLYIPTKFIPKGCVIYTPNLMPGITLPEETR